ncbi:hypothetical protein [Nostoc sp. FACHB-110]|uniref:hypothetical protein n=1 Tax=Nostoc sp. FACHB-110 TaxID=2692834 RepID=UPI0016887C72|nr:hypothetical protein [Nostoc sp. FACHB-110]MBD2437335.1 hypothetical protein [Nostoc sp. FACHB-110]
MNSVNRVPVKDLTNRYNIGKTALYARFEAAGIKPIKEGTRSYISTEELEELDGLDSYLKTGGVLSEFRPTIVPVEEISSIAMLQNEPANFTTNWLMNVVERLIFTSRKSPLDRYRELEEVAQNGWVLSTSDIEAIIGIKPRILGMAYGSFQISRCGKVGREAGWIIKKKANVSS